MLRKSDEPAFTARNTKRCTLSHRPSPWPLFAARLSRHTSKSSKKYFIIFRARPIPPTIRVYPGSLFRLALQLNRGTVLYLDSSFVRDHRAHLCPQTSDSFVNNRPQAINSTLCLTTHVQLLKYLRPLEMLSAEILGSSGFRRSGISRRNFTGLIVFVIEERCCLFETRELVASDTLTLIAKQASAVSGSVRSWFVGIRADLIILFGNEE